MLPHVDKDLLILRDVEVTDLCNVLNDGAVDEAQLQARNTSGAEAAQVYFLVCLLHFHKEVCDAFHIRVRRPGGGGGGGGRKHYRITSDTRRLVGL